MHHASFYPDNPTPPPPFPRFRWPASRSPFDQSLQRSGQSRRHYKFEFKRFPQHQQLAHKTPNRPAPLSVECGAVCSPTNPRKAQDIVRATAVAGTQPKTGHETHLAQHRQQRCSKAGAHPCVAHRHPILLSILMQQARRVQIQCIASRTAGQTLQTPSKQPAKTAQIASRTGEPLEKSRQGRLARHPLDPQHLRHHRVAPQVCHVRQLLGLGITILAQTQAPCIAVKDDCWIWAADAAGISLTMESSRPAKRTKTGGPSMRTELLVGELDLDGLIGSFELNLRCHRFGEPGVCPTIALFSSTTNHSPFGGPFSTAWVRLSGCNWLPR